MARYRTSVRSSRPADEAFAFVADLRNLVDWDPGVKAATQARGDGPGPTAVYEVTLASPPGYQLRYETTEFETGRSTMLVAKSGLFTSIDRISAVDDEGGEGSVLTYDAELKLNGILGLGDPFLRLAFGRIGDRAAAGLRKALDGEFVA